MAVFYDASGRRRRRFRVAVIAFAALILLSLAIFVASIGAVPSAPLLPIRPENAAFRTLHPPHEGLLSHTRRTIDWYARRIFGQGPECAKRNISNAPLAIAFHAPWDPSSAASLQRHIGQLDWLIPGWVSITGPDHHITVFPRHGRARHHQPGGASTADPADGSECAARSMGRRGHRRAARMIRRSARRCSTSSNRSCSRNHAGGAFFDFEELPPAAQRGLSRLSARRRSRRFAPHGWVIAIAVPVGDPDWDLQAYAAVVDTRLPDGL